MQNSPGKISLVSNLLAKGEVRIESAANPGSHYDEDKKYFDEHRKRTCFIRQSFSWSEDFDFSSVRAEMPGSETPVSKVSTLFMYRPQLFILVMRLSEVHVLVPIWRGKPFFRVSQVGRQTVANADTDATVMQLAVECERREGFDAEEWATFCESFSQALADAKAVPTELRPMGLVH